MHSTDGPGPAPYYGSSERRALLEIAFSSIEYGLSHHTPLPLDAESCPERLRQLRATFTTLKLDGELRGCIGSIEARKPLAVDVADNAYSSSFADPRFPPLTRAELERLSVSISILSPLEPLRVDSEHDIPGQLRPGVDGLVLEEGERYRSTFLPVVWEALPRPEAFLRQLKLKAGLPGDYWSGTVRISRYTTESIEGDYATGS